MKRVMSIAAGSCALLLAACSTELQQAQNQPTPTAGTEFTQSLSYYYRTAAQSQWTGHTDFAGSEHLAGKSLAAGKGEAVLPDAIENRGRPIAMTSDLVDSRNRLMAAFGRNAATIIPDDAARAQVAYDCWLEEASDPVQAVESKWLENKVRNCRDDFYKAMAQVDAATPEKVARHQRYVIFFENGSAAITRDAQKTLQDAANYVRQNGGSRISVIGGTDRVGKTAYNQALSERRAEAVQQALSHEGVPEAQIKTEGRGEDHPEILTPEGVAEPRNRHADIDIESP